jgi:hypothetical protein
MMKNLGQESKFTLGPSQAQLRTATTTQLNFSVTLLQDYTANDRTVHAITSKPMKYAKYGRRYLKHVPHFGNAVCLSKNVKTKIYDTILLPLVLYGCKTQSVTFDNRVLTRIFGLKRDEVGGWRKLYNKELSKLNSSPCIIRMIKPRRVKWAGHVACMGEKNVYRLLVGK